MIYELRTYGIAAGQMADELRRMAILAYGGEPDPDGRVPGYGASLMAECGVPPMLGVWSASAGEAERFFYLCRYHDIDDRDTRWTRFWNHPGLARAIGATTRHAVQVVDWTFPILMRPNPAWAAFRRTTPRPATTGRLHELRIDRVAFGEGRRAHDILAESDLPALARHGAALLGSFDVWMGPDIPSIVTFLALPSIEARAQGLAALDRDPSAAARRRHRLEAHAPIFERNESYLLDPAPYCFPEADFGDEG